MLLGLPSPYKYRSSVTIQLIWQSATGAKSPFRTRDVVSVVSGGCVSTVRRLSDVTLSTHPTDSASETRSSSWFDPDASIVVFLGREKTADFPSAPSLAPLAEAPPLYCQSSTGASFGPISCISATRCWGAGEEGPPSHSAITMTSINLPTTVDVNVEGVTSCTQLYYLAYLRGSRCENGPLH